MNGSPWTFEYASAGVEELRPYELDELAGVELGHEHRLVLPEHVAEVGRERVEVDEVRDATLPPREPARAARRQ